MYYPLEIKQAYNFTLRAPGILGIGYTNAIVMAIMDYDSAKLVQDVIPLHVQAYPFLLDGTPRNAADLTYVKIRTTIGEIRVIAMDWIAQAPVLVESTKIRVTITAASSNTQLINDILVQNGFSNLEIEVI